MAIASGKEPGGNDLQALQQLLAAGGGMSSGGQVYMGEYSTYGVPKGASAQSRKNIQELGALEAGRGHKGSIWLSKQQAEGDFYNWDTKKQSDFVAKGILSGMLKLGDGPLEGAKLWKKLVDEASNYGAAGKKVSPYDLLASYVQASGGANAWKSAGVFEINTVTGERKYVGPGTYLGNGKAQQTDSRVDLTDPDTAHAVATKLFQDMMGRDPNPGELGSFAGALNSAEQNSPVVQTTTTQYNMDTGQPISSSTQSSGGVSEQGKEYIGEQQIKGKKEYGAYQAATTYQDALDALVFGSGA